MRNQSYKYTATKSSEASEKWEDFFQQVEEFKNSGWYKAIIKAVKKTKHGAIVECIISSMDGKTQYGVANGFLSNYYCPEDFTDSFLTLFPKDQLGKCKGKAFKAFLDYSDDGEYINILGAAPLEEE